MAGKVSFPDNMLWPPMVDNLCHRAHRGRREPRGFRCCHPCRVDSELSSLLPLLSPVQNRALLRSTGGNGGNGEPRIRFFSVCSVVSVAKQGFELDLDTIQSRRPDLVEPPLPMPRLMIGMLALAMMFVAEAVLGQDFPSRVIRIVT